MTASKYEDSFWVNETFWNWIMVMVTQRHERKDTKMFLVKNVSGL